MKEPPVSPKIWGTGECNLQGPIPANSFNHETPEDIEEKRKYYNFIPFLSRHFRLRLATTRQERSGLLFFSFRIFGVFRGSL
jgi:hypothetical protein